MLNQTISDLNKNPLSTNLAIDANISLLYSKLDLVSRASWVGNVAVQWAVEQ